MIRYFSNYPLEAGCDEAGRGSLAGPVFAAAVILPIDFSHPKLNDSKKLSGKDRAELREYIESHALDFAVASVDEKEIDRINILKASIKAMHLSLKKLSQQPTFLIIDGNRFLPYKDIPHVCIPKGDAIYASIAAASILAKTYRDDYMIELSKINPEYGWAKNKGYGTRLHRAALLTFGPTIFHRKTFKVKNQSSVF